MNHNVCIDYNHKSCCRIKLYIAHTRVQVFASVLPPVHGGERGWAFSLDSLEAFLECRMPVLRLFFRNSYLCISRGPFVLSRFFLVPFVFSSQSDTDLAIYGDGNMLQTLNSRERLLKNS